MYKRYIKEKIEKALSRSPVVLLTGARQTGKTVLVEEIAQEKNYSYLTLDDIPTYLAAKNDPVSFIKDIQKPVIIDEIQRVSELFLVIKREVDKNRVAGNFLITGSVNPLLIPTVSDALTGRIETLTLYPLAQTEIENSKINIIENLFDNKLEKKCYETDNSLIYEKIITGGYPVLQNIKNQDKKVWINEYIKNIVQKDAQDISKITEPKDLYMFLYSLAHRAAGLLNISDLSRNLGLSQATLQRYSSLLEALYLIYYAYPWHIKTDKKFLKSKKSYLIDSGFLANLLKITNIQDLKESNYYGNIVENFVALEILKQASWSNIDVELYHFRTINGIEVDLVLEDENKNLVGIEVKASRTVSSDDFKGLNYLKSLVPDQMIKGVVLYMGDNILPFGENLLAVPISRLWE